MIRLNSFMKSETCLALNRMRKRVLQPRLAKLIWCVNIETCNNPNTIHVWSRWIRRERNAVLMLWKQRKKRFQWNNILNFGESRRDDADVEMPDVETYICVFLASEFQILLHHQEDLVSRERRALTTLIHEMSII